MPRWAWALTAVAVAGVAAYSLSRSALWREILAAAAERETELRAALGLEEQ